MRPLPKPVPIKCPFCGEPLFDLTHSLALGETLDPRQHLAASDGGKLDLGLNRCPKCRVVLNQLVFASVLASATVAAVLSGLTRRGQPGFGRAALRPRKPTASPLSEADPDERPEPGTRVAVMHLTPGVPGEPACGQVACYAHGPIDPRDGFRMDQFAYADGSPLQTRPTTVGQRKVYRYVCQSCKGIFGARDLAQAIG